ncbi:MAG: 3-keto-5-aminohexanoate cleavage protein [Gammaproteobacteria bacterium]|nr:3-keto-5-aminohexanoate cleavage protein [Gammaproteobacteria bacterium]
MTKSDRSSGKTCVMAAPNGARLVPDDHAAVPVTIAQTIETTVACRAQGAQALHAHVRDDQLLHCLDTDRYRALISGLETALGKNFPVQVTTEAVGRYSTDEQMQLVRDLKPRYISAAVREFIPDDSDVNAAADFYRWCVQNQVGVQHIIYDDNDLQRYFDYKTAEVIPLEHQSVLIVLGRYVKDQLSDPSLVDHFAKALEGHDLRWMLCAFGHTETQCLVKGAQHGAGCRVGFENNRLHPDQTIAESNEERVATLLSEIKASTVSLATEEDIHFWLGGYANA